MSAKVGYAPGVYDLFHIGHLNILRHSRGLCDFLIAGVVSDEVALRAKNKRPVVPANERVEIVRHIQYVDDAVVEDVHSKMEMWQRLKFDIIFKGDDWRGTPKGDQLEADFAAVGVDVVYFPYTAHTSSTMLRQALSMISEAAH